jgi:tetratricopeptide (TPR) repeat protein
MMDNYAPSLDYFERALFLSRQVEDRYMEALILTFMYLRDPEDLVQAQAVCEQATAICREIGHLQGEASSLNDLSMNIIRQGKLLEARRHFERMVDISRQIGNRQHEATALESLGGYIAEPMGQFELANRYQEEAIEIFRQISDKMYLAGALLGWGHTLIGLGKLEQAEEVFRKVIEIHDDLGQTLRGISARTGLAQLLLLLGRAEHAFTVLEPVMAHLAAGNSLYATWEIIFPFRDYLATIRVLQANEDPRAEELLDEGYRLMQDHAARIPDPADRKFFLEDLRWHKELAALWEARRKEE